MHTPRPTIYGFGRSVHLWHFLWPKCPGRNIRGRNVLHSFSHLWQEQVSHNCQIHRYIFSPFKVQISIYLCPAEPRINTCPVESFLAHLSRRLMGELIVYQSLRRPSVRQHFQTSSPLKPLGQLNSNFIWRLLRTREQKFVQIIQVT